MPIIALYNFDDIDTTALDSAVGNGAQNGLYLNGATAVGGQATLDGENDIVKIYPNPVFQMDTGTLDIAFTLGADPLTETQTVLSRDSAGLTDGGYRIEILANGSIVISHESTTGVETFGTPAGFANPGDAISLSYSWDQGGETGRLVISNATTGDDFTGDVPNTLTMDMSGQGVNQPWIVGAGQSASDPDALNNINQHFEGSVSMFQLSDTVDNLPERDGIVRGTTGGDLIDGTYVDPFDGDRIDASDAIIPGDAPNDDRVEAGAGNDTVISGLGDDTVNAGGGDDSVTGGAGDDSLNGESGNDRLIGGDGSDTVNGGDGNDLIDTSGTAPLPDVDYPGFYGADIDPANDRDLVAGGAGNDTIRTGDDADTISGDAGDDLIDAGIDADRVSAGSGNDTVIGSEGADTIDGGLGNDLIYGGLNDVIGEALDLPDATDLRPDNNRDSLIGGEGNDTIYGRDDDDTLEGGAGNDLLDGGIDEDVILGGAGNDTVLGGQGADSATGGDDRDVFVLGSQTAGLGDVIDGSEGGDDFDTLDLRGAGPLAVVYDPTNPENGTVTFYDADRNPTGTMTFTNIENVIPCFTPGTLIATPKGEVPVEFLKAGDRVITRDNGIQEIRWTGQKVLGWKDLAANPHLKPVLIRQGSLGNGLPERDMMVSPNHRMLVANDRTALYFDEHEVLVAAKHLVASVGIQSIESIGTTYIHFMFDRHEVVLGNGAWTESFQPGDQTLKGMGNAQRSEIFELFPELKTADGLNDYHAARRTLKKHEARLLVR